MRINKKLLILIPVIILGLLAGAGFSLLTRSQNDKNIAIEEQSPENNSPGLSVGMGVEPSTIKPAGKNVDVKDLTKIDKAVASITYNNDGAKNLTGVQIWITITSQSPVGVASPDEIKFNEKLSNQNVFVFDVPSAKANSLNFADVFIFADNPGTIKMDAEVRTKEGIQAKTNTATVTVK